MNTRIFVGGLIALLAMTSAARASRGDTTLGDVVVVRELLEAIDPETLHDKQNKNREKAIDRLAVDGSDFNVWIHALRRSAKPLAKAVAGTPHQAAIENGIIAILVGLRADLEDLADEIEDRSEGEIIDEFPDEFPDGFDPDPRPMVLSTKARDKIRKLLAKARVRINSGGGNDQIRIDDGKTLKRRAKALLEAIKKLDKADRKLRDAGM